MAEDKIVVGLDVGTTKICAVVGRLNEFGKIEVLGMGTATSDGVKEGVVSNISKTITAIERAVNDAEDASRIDIKVVNVGVAGRHISSFIQHGNITRSSSDDEIGYSDVEKLTSDMYRVVTEPGTQIIHVLPQSYTVDYETGIHDPVGMSGIKLEGDFKVVVSNTNAIRNLNKCTDRAGLELESVILEPIASSMAVLTEEEKEAGVALVDIGGGTTDVIIYQDKIIRHVSVLPFGGNIITSDIKQGCSVMNDQAELLKVKFGKTLSVEASENEVVSIPGIYNRPPKEISIKNLSAIIEARMEEIIDLILLEVDKSGFRNQLAGGIVITGGGSMMKGLGQLFELKSGMDIRVGYPVEYLGKSKVEAIKSPKYATAVGLLLAGFKEYSTKTFTDGSQHVAHQAQPPYSRTKQAPAEKNDMFKSLLKKTRDFLIDDVDDNSKEY